jgi:hypothetical protein
MAEIDLNRWLRCNLTITFPSHPQNIEVFSNMLLYFPEKKKRKEKLTYLRSLNQAETKETVQNTLRFKVIVRGRAAISTAPDRPRGPTLRIRHV